MLESNSAQCHSSVTSGEVRGLTIGDDRYLHNSSRLTVIEVSDDRSDGLSDTGLVPSC